jgi:hypothetical protein
MISTFHLRTLLEMIRRATGQTRPPEPEPEPEGPEDDPEPEEPPGPGRPNWMAKGRLADVQHYLDEIDAVIRSPYFTARELCLMPHNGGYSIPPRSHWPRMKRTIDEVALPIRLAYDGPLNVRGYRDPSYNREVNGSSGSRHQWFEALDLRPAGGGDIRALRRIAIDHFLDHPKLSIGLGLYAGNIHIDIGFRRRTWGSRQSEIAERRKVKR